ncbi:MAG: hypothetical protein ACK48W_03015 [Bacteroidota bacterium]|jgi:hypothetical protein
MTNKNYFSLVLIALSIVFYSCEKQQIEKTAKDLKGTFRITEFNYWFKFYNTTLKRSDSIRVQNVFDLKNDIHTLEFFEPNNENSVEFILRKKKVKIELPEKRSAYTSTLRGVYKIEYADLNKAALVDTFYYTVTKDVLTIIDISAKTTQFTQIPGKPRIPNIPFPKRRFKLEQFSGENLFLNGTPYLLNDTCYYKATRLN